MRGEGTQRARLERVEGNDLIFRASGGGNISEFKQGTEYELHPWEGKSGGGDTEGSGTAGRNADEDRSRR